LERSGAKYASLSGSGSTVYGLFADRQAAETAAKLLINNGVNARATVTLPRAKYWKETFAKIG
jgi:4-diphosphocytidyl-2C-methyl-D-erythritol kinase